jgi:uncharacterized membrane protein
VLSDRRLIQALIGLALANHYLTNGGFMKEYRIYTDEKITVWQRVGLVIKVESERELNEILNEPGLFKKAMSEGRIEYNGEVSPYWETEDHQEWDHDNHDQTEITRRIA